MPQFGFREGVASGRDLVDGKPKACLGLMWMLMRVYFEQKHGIKSEEEFKAIAEQFLVSEVPEPRLETSVDLPTAGAAVIVEQLELEPLMIVLYYGDEGEVFMTFHDES